MIESATSKRCSRRQNPNTFQTETNLSRNHNFAFQFITTKYSKELNEKRYDFIRVLKLNIYVAGLPLAKIVYEPKIKPPCQVKLFQSFNKVGICKNRLTNLKKKYLCVIMQIKKILESFELNTHIRL